MRHRPLIRERELFEASNGDSNSNQHFNSTTSGKIKTAVKRANEKDKRALSLAFQPFSFWRRLAFSVLFLPPSLLDLPGSVVPANGQVHPLDPQRNPPGSWSGLVLWRCSAWMSVISDGLCVRTDHTDVSHKDESGSIFKRLGSEQVTKKPQRTQPVAPEHHFSATNGFGLSPSCFVGQLRSVHLCRM